MPFRATSIWLSSLTRRISARSFTTSLLDEIDKVDQRGKQNPGEVAKFIAPLIGIDLPIIDLAAHRLSYGVKPVTPEVLAAQQKIADKFFELKLVPKLVRVVDAAWSQGVKQIAGK